MAQLRQFVAVFFLAEKKTVQNARTRRARACGYQL
jgi:hypothetical protein